MLEPIGYGLDFTLGSSLQWRTQEAFVKGRLEILRALCTSNAVTAEHRSQIRHPADSIRDYIVQEQPDPMIMGTHGRRGISRMVYGSVAEAMLRLAPCPVLTLPAPVFGEEHERVMPCEEEWFERHAKGDE